MQTHSNDVKPSADRRSPMPGAVPPMRDPLTPEVLNARAVDLTPSSRPTLFVVVDTEETFDWNAPFSRANTDVRAISKLMTLQRLLSRYAIRPTYVIDYPVATEPRSAATIRALVDAGADVGAHLHPWVNPPFDEEVSGPNSFGCNLDPELEAVKIRVLRDAIVQHVGEVPRVFKAGRYGFGLSTAATLEAQGFDVDASINPHMDYSHDLGPSFDAFDTRPFLFGTRPLLEVPCSTGYTGLARRVGAGLHSIATSRWLRPTRATGVLARTGVLNKVMLSPEGFLLEEMCALASTLYTEGHRTFSLTLHSPSMEPGCTPYVRSDADLRDFVARIEGFADFFFTRLGGVSASLVDFYGLVAPAGAPFVM